MLVRKVVELSQFHLFWKEQNTGYRNLVVNGVVFSKTEKHFVAGIASGFLPQNEVANSRKLGP
ncbi:hypothetical protein Poly41_48790 [Novipirellula artificiosorum]|uniref:Uncharacterized protein n=1 Tax=Novipirellula artificiosorum TaxID=2528016 RepID=A0A5C6DFW2_9BACT|nr:hypothetical protein Poly41_48790 [Novipirellula artificiosorum]